MAVRAAGGVAALCRRIVPVYAVRSGGAPAASWGAARWQSTKSEGSIPDSHDDFKPKYRATEEVLSVHDLIEKDIKENPVVVYMKGVPEAPQCGFSGMVVRILDHYGVTYKARNVLEDSELREGIKTFSQWPTIPQVYIGGEFVGGCDILMNMQKTGELENKLTRFSKEGS